MELVKWSSLQLDQKDRVKQANFQAVGYAPLPKQAPIHDADAPILLISGGEGGGKSYVTAAEALGRFPYWQLGYIVGPKYESAHKECDYLYDWLRQIGATEPGLYTRPTQGKLRLETRLGQVIETLSSEDGPKAITGTGESPDWILMVEAGKQTYDIFLACLARVSRCGGDLILSGTIEQAERWFPDLYNRYQVRNDEGGVSFCLPTWDNTYAYPGGRDDPRIKRLEAVYTPELFQERFGAVPCPPANLVFPEFAFPKHVFPAPYWSGDPLWRGVPVEVWVDPGYAGAYAVLAVQIMGDTVWQIDEVYVRYGFASDVILQCKERPWWDQVEGGVIDVAARQHQGMQSHEEIWRDEANLTLVSERVLIDDGVQRHHTFLANTLTGEARLFHDPRCANTLAEYNLYKRHVDTGVIIDRDNHAMKALAYGLCSHFGLGDEMMSALPERPLPDQFAGLYFKRR